MEAYQEKQTESRQMRIFCNNTQSAGAMVAPHWHTAYEILYIRRGWGRQRINQYQEPFYPADVIVIYPGDVHATEALAASGCDVDVVQFAPELLGEAGEWGDALRSGILRAADAPVKQLFEALRQHARDDRPGQWLLLTGLIRQLAGTLMRFDRPETPRSRSSLIEAVCAHLEQAEELRLERVAAHFGYCPEHLSRRFHAEVGMAYRDYCEQVRMRRAIRRLGEGQRGLSAIAEELGYSDDSSFIRAFKRVYGITPSVYMRYFSEGGPARNPIAREPLLM